MKAEILAPAGDEQSAYAALKAGADAVYLGLTQFSARAGAENFDASALRRTAKFAHFLGAKIYVCLNTLVKDGETEGFFRSAREAWNAGADALLVQDIFLGKRLKEVYPEMTLHLSTQGGCCNVYGARLAKEFGFSRAVLARETPLDEIKKISEIIETECFVQGALCTAFSGQCYLSSFAGNNSGNRGRCKQPCRKKYSLDRAGYEKPAYALSTSDLCVGARVAEYVAAGVSSLKIEGRLRRREYCAAAVRYYRALLQGLPARAEFSDLKRAYNRGGYTAGLAFGQADDFLSRKTQGHIGEDVGELFFVNGAPFCKSSFAARKGDCFKILRAGEEVCGGVYLSSGKNGFFLSGTSNARTGDRVCVTTDTAAGERALSRARLREVSVELRFAAGAPPYAKCGDFELLGKEPLAPAKNAPLSAEEISECFRKTDAMPVSPRLTVQTEGAFCPKSALNAFRREFYEGLINALVPEREPLEKRSVAPPALRLCGKRERAAISEELSEGGGIVIFKPRDYEKLPKTGTERAYLYLPAFFTSKEIEALKPEISRFYGIYCDGYYGVKLAEACKTELFAGTGFNLCNGYAVAEAKKYAGRFVLSKELSARDQNALAAEGAFALLQGGIKAMDLIYCPFSRTCAKCDKREYYTATDEDGRSFPLRRYRAFGACRFELYNCAPLRAEAEVSPLADETAKELLRGRTATRGHEKGSMQ